MTATDHPAKSRSSKVAAFAAGCIIGIFGGMIGLGGAEFRLPILIGFFSFPALEAVILNKAMSLIVVAFALPFRASAVPFSELASHWPIIVNLLAGSIAGAWLGAGWATRLRSESLYKVIALLLVMIAVVLLLGHDPNGTGRPLFDMPLQVFVGIGAGFAIGIVAAILGVAGGELLIPTIVLLFGADIKLAGSLSLAVSLPTMIAAFARYSRDGSFSVLGRNRSFAITMAAGSIVGAFIGGQLLGVVPNEFLLPFLAILLLLSAVKVWRHT
ncbi:sulfite exporter TauE/SafE family protein [Bosea sp. 117]|uniref:sulfite exporter TauE/SafE family protein n=1 Tax=Bosea sp. 117 TaxID=1125973 RepID=UPI000493CEF4|nr:sulfite exporter TauE/SafE family protein [Bosea sp. 117]